MRHVVNAQHVLSWSSSFLLFLLADIFVGGFLSFSSWCFCFCMFPYRGVVLVVPHTCHACASVPLHSLESLSPVFIRRARLLPRPLSLTQRIASAWLSLRFQLEGCFLRRALADTPALGYVTLYLLSFVISFARLVYLSNIQLCRRTLSSLRTGIPSFHSAFCF